MSQEPLLSVECFDSFTCFLFRSKATTEVIKHGPLKLGINIVCPVKRYCITDLFKSTLCIHSDYVFKKASYHILF